MSTETRAYQGTYDSRFDITRTDGQPIDPSRRYMVLSFDGSDPDAVAALRFYADLIAPKNPLLATALSEILAFPASAPAQHRWAK